MQYFKFEISIAENITSHDGLLKSGLKVIVMKSLEWIIPKANPDYDNKINLVRWWLLEIDPETGLPLREIGLDSHAEPILKMPFKNNYGYWTDNELVLKDFIERFGAEKVDKSYFESHWSRIE